ISNTKLNEAITISNKKLTATITQKFLKMQSEIIAKTADSKITKQILELERKMYNDFAIVTETLKTSNNILIDKMENLEKEIKQVEQTVNEERQNVGTTTQISEIQTNLSEMKKIVQEKPDIITELEEKDKRKNNLVSSNVPESRQDTARQRQMADISVVCDLIEFQLGLGSVNISRTTRLGTHEGDSRRPLLVIFENTENRDKVLKAAPRLRKSTSLGFQ
ncbi:unnamed protein product, partial [Owenia fusiformis]